ncbi:hypothetical protein [Pseudalkalibacillus caeni]|uniref:hypothetical protein n=1 Tax=Exobacillus caeni TaxID=2574798 RepID=UPI0015F2D6DB|nr:hypothetical protein [Pseudalkalibacillus caeni]
MNIFSRWIVPAAFIFIAILLLNKGIGLWSLGTNVDGDGIGVHFFVFEINDRVPEARIPYYAKGFFAASAMMMLFGIGFLGKNFLNLKLHNNND